MIVAPDSRDDEADKCSNTNTCRQRARMPKHGELLLLLLLLFGLEVLDLAPLLPLILTRRLKPVSQRRIPPVNRL